MASVLIIEDEATVAMVLREALRDEGHEVETVADGAAGLRRLAGPPRPDVVLLDLFMPGLGGREVIEHMRTDAALAEIPVVLITGAVPRVSDFPPEGSYQVVLGKPFDLNDVVAAVDRLCAGRPVTGRARDGAGAGGCEATGAAQERGGIDRR